MKQTLAILSAALLAVIVLNCEQDAGADTMQYNTVFPKGDRGPKEYFTGTTWVNMLHTDTAGVFDTQAYDVIFEPAARTNWHSHPG